MKAMKAMAEIFAQFQAEVARLKFFLDEAESARRLLREFAGKVKAELGVLGRS